MVPFIRFGDTILAVEHVSSVIRTSNAVEVRMIRVDGSAEPEIHRFEGAAADHVWDAFCELGEPDILAGLDDSEHAG